MSIYFHLEGSLKVSSDLSSYFAETFSSIIQTTTKVLSSVSRSQHLTVVYTVGRIDNCQIPSGKSLTFQIFTLREEPQSRKLPDWQRLFLYYLSCYKDVRVINLHNTLQLQGLEVLWFYVIFDSSLFSLSSKIYIENKKTHVTFYC